MQATTAQPETTNYIAELKREASERGASHVSLAAYGPGPIEAGAAMLRLLDSAGLSAVLLALMVFHYRSCGGLRAALDVIARWSLAQGCVTKLFPALNVIHMGEPGDRRRLELAVRSLVRGEAALDGTPAGADGSPRHGWRREAADAVVEQLDVAIADARRWWDAQQPAPTAPEESTGVRCAVTARVA